MRNLENYGVLELNAKEIRETDGGFFMEAMATIATIAAIIVLVDAAAEEFMEGWNNPK